MKSDVQMKADVEAELDWDRAVNATNVGVSVKDSIVTLSGHIDTYAEKSAIERAVQRVEGVKAVAIELDVKLAPGHHRSDSEIAAAVETAFSWHALIPAERLKVRVENGWVTLSGELDWDYQRRSAETAVRALTGVVGVTNSVTLRPQTTSPNVVGRIREALTRRAEREARNIDATINGSTVTLHGSVHTWADRAAAEGAAWSAIGVTRVVNELKVGG